MNLSNSGSFEPTEGPHQSQHGSSANGQPGLTPESDLILNELHSSEFDTIRLEAAVALFCSEIDKAENPDELTSHPAVGTIRNYLRASANENFTDLQDRFETTCAIIQDVINDNLDPGSPEFRAAHELLASEIFGETASCLASDALSTAVRANEFRVQKTLVDPFCLAVNDDLLRINMLSQSPSVHPDQRAEESINRYNTRFEEADSLFNTIFEHYQELADSFPVLMQQAIQRFEEFAPSNDREYLERLEGYISTMFEPAFVDTLNQVHDEQVSQLARALKSIHDKLPRRM